MDELKRAKLLKELYIYKYLGFEYFKDITALMRTTDQFLNLPNDWEELRKVVLNCRLCQLSKTRKNVVFGEGDIHAKVMFIGEGPGAVEDETGRPFVGRAGQLLTKIIENVLEIKREQVYIANIVKCRPPNNRVPLPEEVRMCKPFLLKQIELISPKIIVALGSTSYRHLTGDNKTPISKIRGEILDFNGIKLIPTFHPSFLLRNPSAKKDVYQDMLKVKAML